MNKLRAALIGLGMMGKNHARILSSLDGVDLVAVADPQGDVMGALPNHQIFRTVEEVITKGVDYCIVATPTAFHEEVSIKLIEAGIHLLIEKPVAHTHDSALRILAAARKENIVCAVGHIERYNSALQQARKRIMNNELGDIYQISTRRQGPFPSRISDVGVVMDLATHDVDLTSWMSDAMYVAVNAQAATRSHRKSEDLVAVVGQLDNGVVVNHLVNWLSPLKERKIVITGERGTFVVDTLHSDLTLYTNGTIDISQQSIAHFKGVTQGDIHIYAFSKPEPLRVEHESFRDAILGKPNELVSIESGATTVKIAELIIESYKNQKTILA
jgi:UDP-N-acetylglucosamine 3-dehydrogenase